MEAGGERLVSGTESSLREWDSLKTLFKSLFNILLNIFFRI